MERDLRETPLYKEVEAFARSVLGPGFGTISDATDAVPSPDGRWVAFTGSRLEKMEGHRAGRICLAAADGSGFRQITDGPNDDAQPRWSPDSTRLTFLSDRAEKGVHQLYVLDTDTPSEARRLAELPGVVEWHAWSADGRAILVGVAGNQAEQADALGSGTVGSEGDVPVWAPFVESSDEGDAERRSLWVVDAATGEARRVSDPARNVWEAAWCGPDAAVAIVSDGAGEEHWYGAGLSVVDVATGAERRLVTSDVQLGWVEGSADGSVAAVIEAVCSDRYVVCGDLLLVDTASGSTRTVDLLGADASRACFRERGDLIVFGRRGLDSVVLTVDPASATATEVWSTHEDVGRAFNPEGRPFGEGFVSVLSSRLRPPAVVAVEGGVERVVADLRHEGHQVVLDVVGRADVLRWTSIDGLGIEGLLTVPTGEGPFPLVLRVHGGPIATVGDSWLDLGLALLVSRGFAVLQPNPRGSTGRGRAFAEAVLGDMGGLDLHDDLTGVDAAVATGIADPQRLLLTGGSYGGFMSAWIPTQDHRFKAAVSISPVTDWWSERFDSSLGVWAADYLGGDPQEVPDAYTARSPVLHAARCRTPVLLTAGYHDRATPVGQAVEFYRALREHGVPSEVVKYPQEGHGVGDLPAMLDLFTRMVGWFERFLPVVESPQPRAGIRGSGGGGG
jgi:dipeptidyl aminopeptidase/acylaminoacyl peptidase